MQQRLWKVNNDIADAIAVVIGDDTGLPYEQSKLLAISLVGIAQVSARYWVSGGTQRIALDEAKQLVSSLVWRGIGGFPKSAHPDHPEHLRRQAGARSPTVDDPPVDGPTSGPGTNGRPDVDPERGRA